MRFFNYLIGILNKKSSCSNNETKRAYYQEEKSERSEDDEKNKNELPYAKKFEKDITELFNMIQNEEAVNLVTEQDLEESRFTLKRQQSLIESNNRENLETSYKEERRQAIIKKNEYAEQVKAYSSLQIGSKISPNTELFSETQIKNGDLSLENHVLFRVATKWVEELEKCFDEKNILKRDFEYRMMDSSLG